MPLLPRSLLDAFDQSEGLQLKLGYDAELERSATAASEAANNNPANLLAQAVPMEAPGPTPYDLPSRPLNLAVLDPQVQPTGPNSFLVGMDDPTKLFGMVPDSPGPQQPSGPANANVGAWADLIARASKEFGVPKDVLAGIMDIESGGNQTAQSSQGAIGLMQVLRSNFNEGEDPWDPETNVRTGARMLAERYRRYGSWEKAAASYFGAIDANGNITEAQDAGGQTGSGYVQKFNDARLRYGDLADAPDTPANGSLFGITPDQFKAGFDAATAYAACGIVAAMAFAKANGRMPTPEEARELAVNYGGWSIEQGMGGPVGVVNVLAKMGIAAHQEKGINFEKVKADLASGNPVVVDTPGHYYVIEAYDPSTGRYKLGNDQDQSTPDWATEDEIMKTRWGAPRNTIHADNPASPGLSVANTANDADMQPGEDPLNWSDRLGSMLSSGRTQIQNAWNVFNDGAQNAGSYIADTGAAAVQRVGEVLGSVGAEIKNPPANALEAVADMGSPILLAGRALANIPEALQAAHKELEKHSLTQLGSALNEALNTNADYISQAVDPIDFAGRLSESMRQLVPEGANFSLRQAAGITDAITQFVSVAAGGGKPLRETVGVDNPLSSVPIPGTDEHLAEPGAKIGIEDAVIQFWAPTKYLKGAQLTALGGQLYEHPLEVGALTGGAFLGGKAVGALARVGARGIGALAQRGAEAVDNAIPDMAAINHAQRPINLRPVEGGADTRTVDLYHYSAEPRTRLDPSFQGTGQMGAEKGRIFDEAGNLQPGQVRYNQFYAREGEDLGARVEAHRFGGQYLHNTQMAVGEGGLYPTTSHARRPSNADLQAQGYKGLYFTDAKQAHVWEPVDVENLGRSSVTRGDFDNVYAGNARDFLEGGPGATNLPARPMPLPDFQNVMEINNHTRANQGGTFIPEEGWRPMAPSEPGFVVGGGGWAKAHDGPLSNNQLNAYLADAQGSLGDGKTFGTWQAGGKTYLDVGDKVDDMGEAIQLAQRRGQQAIWDNARGEEVTIMSEEQSNLMKGMLADGATPEEAMNAAGVREYKPISGGAVPYNDETSKLRGKKSPYRQMTGPGERMDPDPIPGVPRPETGRSPEKWFPSKAQGIWVGADSTLELSRYRQLETSLAEGTPDPLSGRVVKSWDKVDPKTYGSMYTQLSQRQSKFAPDIEVTFTDGTHRLEEIKSDFIGSYDTNQSKIREYGMEHGKEVDYKGTKLVYLTNNEIGNNAIRSFQHSDFPWYDGPEWGKVRGGFMNNTRDDTAELARFEAEHGYAGLKERLAKDELIIRDGHYMIQDALEMGLDIRKLDYLGNPFAPTGDHPKIAGARYDIFKIKRYLASNPAMAGLIGFEVEKDENGEWQVKATDDPLRGGIALMATPQGRAAFARALPKVEQALKGAAPAAISNVPVAQNVGDWVRAVRYNSMLSGPRTLLVNVVGGGIETVYKPLRDALIQHPETTAFEWLGGMKSFDSALAGAVEVLRHGLSNTQAARGDVPNVRLGGAAGAVLSVPSKILGSFDEFFHQLQYGMEIGKQASMIARDIDSGSQLNIGGIKATFSRKLDLKERAAIFDALMTNPTQEMSEAALNAANRGTYKGEMGKAGEAFAGAIEKANQVEVAGVGLGQLFAPFIKTPYHIGARGVDRTPIGLAAAIFDAATGRATSLNPPTKERIADGVIGTALTIWAYNQALQGNITGSGPEDPRERARAERQGTQWNSVKVGDTWYDYNQMGSWAIPLATAAAAAEVGLYKSGSKKPDEKALTDKLAEAGKRFAEVWTNNGYLSGLGTMADIINGRGASAAENFATNTASSFVPFGSAINTTAQAQDPSMRTPEGIPERLQNRLPRFPGPVGDVLPDRQDLPAKLDVYGRERPNQFFGSAAVAPVKTRNIAPDPVDAELTRIGANVSESPDDIGGVKLSRDQKQTFQATSGQNIRVALEVAMQSDEWKRANDERRKDIVTAVSRDARDRAAALIVAPEDRKITDTGLPPKYNGINDPKEELRIDAIISKVNAWRSNARTMEDPGPEPTDEEWDIWGEYRSNLTDEYRDEVKRRSLESKERKNVPLPFDARKR